MEQDMTLTAKLTYADLRDILAGKTTFDVPQGYQVVDVYQDYEDEKFVVTFYKEQAK